MGKKVEATKKKKVKRAIAKDVRKRPNKNKQKTKKNLKQKNNKNKEEYSQKDEDEESLEEFILPGQKFSTPPAGDATRAFYESLLEQRPDSMMAKKYCVEYGCLEPDKAIEYSKEIEKKKKKKYKEIRLILILL